MIKKMVTHLACFCCLGYAVQSEAGTPIGGDQSINAGTAGVSPAILNLIFEDDTPVSSGCDHDLRLGDSGWVFDDSRADPRYPNMREWANAGVRGGIPCSSELRVAASVSPGDDIQSVIDQVSRGGGGVILLRAGAYDVSSAINMRNGVVLRGESRTETRLVVSMRNSFETNPKRTYAIMMEDVEQAGIENLTLFYSVPGFEPLDRNNFDEPNFSTPWPWENNLKVRRDRPDKKVIADTDVVADNRLSVGFVRFENSHDSWIQNADLIESGTSPISVDRDSSHLTFRGNNVFRCYNKGGGGNCYYSISGDHILMTNETVRKIRHLSLQLGARYNVVFDNNLEIDVNFHNGDDGDNLVEQNRIQLPFVHHWPIIATGSASIGHRPPGNGNLIYRNQAAHKRNGRLNISDSEAVYTVKGYSDVQTEGPAPIHGTFFSIKRE